MLCLTAFFLLLVADRLCAAVVILPPEAQPAFAYDLQFRGLDDMHDQSVRYLGNLPEGTRLAWAGQSVTNGQLIRATRILQHLERAKPTAQATKNIINRRFKVLCVDPDGHVPSNRPMLVTGFYQPNFVGSLTRSSPFLYPVYVLPASLMVQNNGRKETIYRLTDGVV